MSNVILSDFTAGELSEKYASKVTDTLYFKGARKLENMRPVLQGGFKSVGGSLFSKALPSEKFRAIPYVISETIQYLVCIGRSQINIYLLDPSQWGALGAVFTVNHGSLYSEAQLYEVQFCQNYNELYLTHKVHPPKVLKYTGAGFTYSDLVITTNAGEDMPFSTPSEYPGCCAFYGGRLYLSGTTDKPQGVWASMPFNPGNFVKWETIESSISQLKDPDTWADPEVPESEVITETKNLIGDANSFSFEIASDQNDCIVWMATGEEMTIGTIASEWTIPDDITANNISAKLKSRHGSARVQAKMVGNKTMSVQRGRKIIIESESEDSKNLTFSSDHITGDEVLQFDFQRSPVQQVYFVKSDGTLAVLVYDNSNEIHGWYNITHRDCIESVAVVSGESGDYVFVIVSNGVSRWIEQLNEDYFTQTTEEVTVTEGNGIVTEPLPEGAVQLWNNSLSGIGTLTGTNLSTTLPDGVYKIGVGFTSILETMGIEKEGENGTSQLMTKSVSDIHFRVLKGGNFKTGYSSDYSKLKLVTETGIVQSGFRGGYEKDLSLAVVRDQAYPLEVSVMIPDVILGTL